MDERDVQLAGISLHCASWGRADSEQGAVLLIHGLTSSSRAWSRLGPVLASAGFFVVAPDLRGRGQSSKPMHGYNVPQHADDLLSLFDTLGLSSVHVIGHSLGGQIALYLSAMYEGRVQRLAMIDAGAPFPPDAREAVGASLARLDAAYPSLDAYLSVMRRSPVHPWNAFWEQYYRYDAAVHPDGTVTSRVPRAAIEEEMRALEAVNLEVLPAAVRAPTLIVRATTGLLGPDRGLLLTLEAAERLTSAISTCTLVDVSGANHYTILLAGALESSLLAFLTKQPQT